MEKENKNSNVTLNKEGFMQAYAIYPDSLHRAGEEINLKELFSIVWNGKWWIIGITTLFAVLSVAYAINLPNLYQAEARLAVTEDAQRDGGAPLSGQFGGLASLAGVNLQQNHVDMATLAVEILQSRKFLTEFVERHNILPELMASESWDPISGTLFFNRNIYNPDSKEWTRVVDLPQLPRPSSWEYVQAFRDILAVERDSNGGLVTVRIIHRSPVVSQQWVNLLVEDINMEMRERSIEESNRSIAYLEEQLLQTSLTSMQEVFYQIMEQQIKKIMFASIRPEYVFRVIDPAVIPEQRHSPRRSLIAIAGTFFGGIFSLAVVFFIHILRSSNRKNDS